MEPRGVGRLVYFQRNETGLALAVFSGVVVALLLAWAVSERDASVLVPWGLIACAFVLVGVALARTGHRIYEDGAEFVTFFGKRRVLCADVRSVEAQAIELILHGAYTRTTYNVRFTLFDGTTCRIQYIAPRGKEAPFREFLERCGTGGVGRGAAL